MGTPNKNSHNAREIMAAAGCNPILEMCKIVLDQRNEIQLRGRMAAELAKYAHPMLKAIELTGAGGGPVELNVSRIELLKSRIDRLATKGAA